MRLRLRASQKRRADMHGARAKRQRGGDAAAVADAAGGDDRQVDWSAILGSNANNPTACRSARAGSKEPRWPPASKPCAMIASAPAASRALRLVERRRGREPRDALAFARATNDAGNRPMIDDTTVGATSSNASH